MQDYKTFMGLSITIRIAKMTKSLVKTIIYTKIFKVKIYSVLDLDYLKI